MSNNPILHRLSQLVSLLLGARIFVLALFTFTLYVSTFFLFNQEESLRKFVFDYKVHGIIFCSVLSIAAGGLINRFYDREKDKFQKMDSLDACKLNSIVTLKETYQDNRHTQRENFEKFIDDVFNEDINNAVD